MSSVASPGSVPQYRTREVDTSTVPESKSPEVEVDNQTPNNQVEDGQPSQFRQEAEVPKTQIEFRVHMLFAQNASAIVEARDFLRKKGSEDLSSSQRMAKLSDTLVRVEAQIRSTEAFLEQDDLPAKTVRDFRAHLKVLKQKKEALGNLVVDRNKGSVDRYQKIAAAARSVGVVPPGRPDMAQFLLEHLGERFDLPAPKLDAAEAELETFLGKVKDAFAEERYTQKQLELFDEVAAMDPKKIDPSILDKADPKYRDDLMQAVVATLFKAEGSLGVQNFIDAAPPGIRGALHKATVKMLVGYVHAGAEEAKLLHHVLGEIEPDDLAPLMSDLEEFEGAAMANILYFDTGLPQAEQTRMQHASRAKLASTTLAMDQTHETTSGIFAFYQEAFIADRADQAFSQVAASVLIRAVTGKDNPDLAHQLATLASSEKHGFLFGKDIPSDNRYLTLGLLLKNPSLAKTVVNSTESNVWKDPAVMTEMSKILTPSRRTEAQTVPKSEVGAFAVVMMERAQGKLVPTLSNAVKSAAQSLEADPVEIKMVPILFGSEGTGPVGLSLIEVKDPNSGKTIYFDQDKNQFESIEHFYRSNKLGGGSLMVDGHEPQFTDGTWQTYQAVLERGLTVGGMVAGGLATAPVGGPIFASLAVASSLYFVAKGVSHLAERAGNGETINPLESREARRAYLDVVSNMLGTVTMLSKLRALKLFKLMGKSSLARNAARTAQHGFRQELGVTIAMGIETVDGLITDWQKLSSAETVAAYDTLLLLAGKVGLVGDDLAGTAKLLSQFENAEPSRKLQLFKKLRGLLVKAAATLAKHAA